MHRSLLIIPVLGLAACGGGGGGTAGGPSAVITADNAPLITAEVLNAGLALSSLGEEPVASPLDQDGRMGATAMTLATRRFRHGGTTGPLVALGPEAIECLVSGTATVSGDLQDPDTLSPGDRLDLTFFECDDGDGAVISGRLRLTIRSLSGDLDAGLFAGRFDATFGNLRINEAGTITSGNGDIALEWDTTTPGVSELTFSGSRFDAGRNGTTWTLMDFATTVTLNEAAFPTLFAYSATGTLGGTTFAGTVDYVTPVPFQGALSPGPGSGELQIIGASGATIRATALAGGDLRLDTDLDGNGTVDTTSTLPWAEVTAGPS